MQTSITRVPAGWSKPLKLLARALGTLEPAQGRVARARARRRVLGKLHSIRAAVDSIYPTIPTVRARILSTAPTAKVNRAKRSGWVPVPLSHETAILRDFTRAGIRTRLFSVNRSESISKSLYRQVWAPSWALTAWLRSGNESVPVLKKLRTDKKARTIFMVKDTLTQE